MPSVSSNGSSIISGSVIRVTGTKAEITKGDPHTQVYINGQRYGSFTKSQVIRLRDGVVYVDDVAMKPLEESD